MLFNIYLSDIPNTTSQQCGYADDLAPFYSDKTWNTVENVLSQDTLKIYDYLLKWRLKLSMSKTTATAFHLNNRESNRKPSIDLTASVRPA